MMFEKDFFSEWNMKSVIYIFFSSVYPLHNRKFFNSDVFVMQVKN